LREKLSSGAHGYHDEVDLYAEQYDVRESVKKNLYTGRTYNSVDNISQFFAERGMPPPSGLTRRPPAETPPPQTTAPIAARAPEPKKAAAPQPAPAARPVQQSFSTQPASPAPSSRSYPATRPGAARGATGFKAGATVQHPKYGRGTILRREGDGDDAKLTISFPGYGLKKIVEKFAGIKVNE
jgi:DNA helicase-2/ATP-dependent DNA helicase PcrA